MEPNFSPVSTTAPSPDFPHDKQKGYIDIKSKSPNGSKEKEKNNQEQGFAGGGHPPNYLH